MKVYVKKDRLLKLLGEGKVYSKKELVLKEFFGDKNDVNSNAHLGNIPYAQNMQQAGMLAKQQVAKNPTNPVQMISGGDLGNKNNQKKDIVINTDTDTRNLKDVERVINNSPDPDRYDIAINTNPAESKNSKAVMDEMRANSIPFTKLELTKFLKSL